MALRSESLKIGEHTYTVTQLPFANWRELQVLVWPTLYGVLPNYLEHDESKNADDPWTLERVVKLTATLLPMNGEIYGAAIKVLSEVTRVEGKQGPLDTFSELWWGENGYAGLHGWFTFALEVQFVPFLKGMPLDELALLSQETRRRQSLSQSTSTGGFGAS